MGRKFQPVQGAPRYLTTKPGTRYPGLIGLVVGETATRWRIAVEVMQPSGFVALRYVLQKKG